MTLRSMEISTTLREIIILTHILSKTCQCWTITSICRRISSSLFISAKLNASNRLERILTQPSLHWRRMKITTPSWRNVLEKMLESLWSIEMSNWPKLRQIQSTMNLTTNKLKEVFLPLNLLSLQSLTPKFTPSNLQSSKKNTSMHDYFGYMGSNKIYLNF